MINKIEKLKEIAKEEDGLRVLVAETALRYDDPLGTIAAAGKPSWDMLSHQDDMHPVFDAYYDEVEQLRLEHERATHELIPLGDDSKTTLAALAYMATAQSIHKELGNV